MIPLSIVELKIERYSVADSLVRSNCFHDISPGSGSRWDIVSNSKLELKVAKRRKSAES
jgi:hypothetical protein